MTESQNRRQRFRLFPFKGEPRREISKIGLLLLGLVTVCVVFSIAVIQAIQRIKVNGPIYADIIEQKDIVADILPPPLYVIESYLTAIQLSDPAFSKDRELLERKIASLQTEFESRQTHWFDSLALGSIRELVLKASAEPARGVFRIINERIIPAVRQGKYSEAQEITRTTLKLEYQTHRIAIDELVQQATKKAIRVETMAASELDSSYLPRIVALGLLLLAMFLCLILWMFMRTNRKALAIANRMTVELKASELESRTSLVKSARLAEVAKRTTNAVIIMDSSQKVVWINQGFTRILGYELDEVLGKLPQEFLSYGRSDPAEIARMRSAIDRSEGIRIILKIVAKDSRDLCVKIDMQPLLDELGVVREFIGIITDVTKQNLEQERLKSIFAAQSEGIVLQNKAGEIVECNGAAQYILGLTADQLKGRTSLDPRWKATIEDGTELPGDEHPAMVTLRTGRSIRNFVMGIVSPDRGIRWINVNTEPILDDLGTVTSVVASFADITQLREQSKRLQLVIDASKIGTWDWDVPTGNVVYNDNWAQMLGYESSEIEPNVKAWEMILDPHGLTETWNNVRKHLDGETAEYRNEVRLRRKDGTSAWVLATGKVIEKNSDGSPKRMVGIHLDLSETKKLELQFKDMTERYLAAIAGTSDGVWDWKIGTDNVWYSDRFWTLLGFPEDGPFPLNKLNSFVERIHPEDSPNVMEAGPAYNVEYRLRHEDGQYRWIRARGATQFDAGRKPIRMAGTIQDIHDLKSTEIALIAANEQANAASAAKSEFLANMSHEIRTPMTAILGYTDLIEHEVGMPSARETQLEYIKIVRRNGQHLLQIINDILDISKIEAGKMTVENIAVNPAKAIEEVIALMAVRANSKGIKLKAALSPDLPAFMHSDPVRLRQVLVNLIGNAIKFTEIGSVSINANYDAKNRLLGVAITDTGIGLTSEQSANLFGAFAQADTTVTRKFGGTGLGLMISKRLTQLLGGDISIDSELGVGSVFTATFAALQLDFATTSSGTQDEDGLAVQPLSQVIEGSVSSIPDAGHLETPLEKILPLAKLKILLAEDGPDNQRLIAHILRKAGANVHIVENGKLAIEMLTIDATLDSPLRNPSPFDLLLSDMQMPVMDGYAAARWLRARGSAIPIVALTAHAMSSDLNLCIDAGCNAYATKPIEKATLIEVCRLWGHKLLAPMVPRLPPVA